MCLGRLHILSCDLLPWQCMGVQRTTARNALPGIKQLGQEMQTQPHDDRACSWPMKSLWLHTGMPRSMGLNRMISYWCCT